MTLDECRGAIGASVVYQPHPGAPREDGTILRVNDSYAFVLYVGDRTAKATRPADLMMLLRGAR